MRNRYRIVNEECLSYLRTLGRQSFDFTFTSPPYVNKGKRYEGSNQKWKLDDWIEFMIPVVMECVRVTRGYSMFVVNGCVSKKSYQPACEGLVWELHKLGVTCERPAIWHKNPPPNRRDYFANAWEYVLAFKPIADSLYFDWEAIATDRKYDSGGAFRQRTANGKRRAGNSYPSGKKSRPRDVVYVTVGGGHMGADRKDDELACQGEAPYPVRLAEHFIKACCPVGGVVLDPFFGSGTTAIAAMRTSRKCLGVEVGEKQFELAQQRVREYAKR